MSEGKDYRPWFEKYPHWLKEQSDILESVGFTLEKSILETQRRIEFVGHSKTDPQRKLHVAFPTAFPSAPPRIFDAPPSNVLPRHHRPDTRQFCLFGFDGNQWNATKSVADALAEVEELISKFGSGNASSAPEDFVPEPITRSIRYVPDATVLVPPPISTFNGFAQLKYPIGHFLGKFAHEGNSKIATQGRGIILEADFGEKMTAVRPFSEYFGHGGKEIHGNWFYFEKPPSAGEIANVFKQCLQKCKALKKADFYWIALIFNEESGKAGQFHRTWLLGRANAQGEFHMIRTFPYIQEERSVRIPGLEGLEQKTVTIIGCGSLGSKIAANLAASGIRNFRTVDYDFFEPDNAVRHELGVDCFGLRKEVALLNRLCSLNPAVVEGSKFCTFHVGYPAAFAHEQQFYNVVKDSNLIIDATAVHSVSHHLNELSFELRIPTLFTSVTNGAWGGEIVRMIPGKTSCWLCWQDQYFDNKPPSEPESTAEVFAPGCDQPTFTGTTYDLGIVAGLATAMAVETLLPSDDEKFLENYIRWSGKNKDGKPLYLTERLPIISQQNCWLCGANDGL